MNLAYFISFFLYFAILLVVGILFYNRQKDAGDFMVGSRSLNYWVTAIATHATDMSTWLFMAYPGLVYREGMPGCLIAIALTLGMHFTWKYIAPQLRIATEKTNSPTLISYFEKRFNDPAGHIRLLGAVISLVFFTLYISAGIVGLGRAVEAAFAVNYHIAISIGTLGIVAYTLLGGFIAIAWNDFIQGMFVLFILLFVPIYACWFLGGPSTIINALVSKNIALTPFPDFSWHSFLKNVVPAVGWGLGYFGMPHILVNFMGIDNVKNIKKAHTLGIMWQILTTIFSATLIGLIGIIFFAQTGLADSELVFVGMAQQMFPPYLSGFILCGILAAAITTMDSQILVAASTIAQDVYRKFFNQKVSSHNLMQISRLGGLGITFIAFLFAFNNHDSILDLVYHAWSGLGGSFGPLLLASFYWKSTITKHGAFTGILVGGLVAGSWRYLETGFNAPLIPAFILSFLSIYVVSRMTEKVGNNA
ncbi:sodium/proline symporter [Candidatus Babeliales bacterium]|nr:sodium/proline symporter [Candidatus Babeliales bacterium]